jgi:flavin reductase (NADH)
MATSSESSGPVGPADFCMLMASFPTGVAVVTALDACGHPVGMTCSSLASVTLAPPTLLVCLRWGSRTLESVLRQSRFTVNLMHSGAQATAELFASGAQDRFSRVRWQDGSESGGPRLHDDSHAIADCRLSKVTRIGDHAVAFGEVCRLSLGSGHVTQPLLYGLRRYAGWPAEAGLTSTSPRWVLDQDSEFFA